MKFNSMIVGMGEVGKGLYGVLNKSYNVVTRDIDDIDFEGEVSVLHICIRYSDNFVDIVKAYVDLYKPELIDICTTCPPNTTEQISPDACHSTTRGIHPLLEEGIRKGVKHIGGINAMKLQRYYEIAGVECVAHFRAHTTELAHILNNAAYGVNLMLADEMAKVCRKYGVDYYQAVMQYTASHNQTFNRLGHTTKSRMILTPPNGEIGGHCVKQSVDMLPEENRGFLFNKLAEYGKSGKS